jgi:hypothetical protein
MPTVIRERGFDVRVYTYDHPPPHVHVAKGGAVVKIDLESCLTVEIVGRISDRDVGRAEALVAKHASRLKLEWMRIHGHGRTH